jgi:biotin carboxyl carrier protein
VKLPESREERVFQAEVDNKPVKVELVENICYGKPFFINVDGKPYRILLEKGSEATSLAVKIDGVPYLARLENKSQTKQAPSLHPQLAAHRFFSHRKLEKGVVSASMPGKVVLLRAKIGDSVQAGDVLLVLEAMKMENEVVSPMNGVVREVRVTEGASVSLGEVMLVIG